MQLKEAMNVLRLDNDDTDTGEIVQGLLAAVPGYIKVATGMSEEQQESVSLCETVTGFLLRLWYYPECADSDKLQTVVDNLLKSISALANNQ